MKKTTKKPSKTTKKVEKTENSTPKKIQRKLGLNIIKVLPKVYQQMQYTPQELWKKFIDYLKRSDKNSEEITVSGFLVFAGLQRNYLNKNKVDISEESQEKGYIIDMILGVLESRYEQKSAMGHKVDFILCNRFGWENKNTIDNKHQMIHPDIKDILDSIIKKKPNDGNQTN